MNMLMSHFKEEYFSMRTGITNREHMKEVKNIPWKLMDKRILEAHPGYKEGTTSRGGPVCCLPVGFSNDSSLEEQTKVYNFAFSAESCLMALAYIDSNDIEIYRVDSNGNSVFMSYVNEGSAGGVSRMDFSPCGAFLLISGDRSFKLAKINIFASVCVDVHEQLQSSVRGYDSLFANRFLCDFAPDGVLMVSSRKAVMTVGVSMMREGERAMVLKLEKYKLRGFQRVSHSTATQEFSGFVYTRTETGDIYSLGVLSCLFYEPLMDDVDFLCPFIMHTATVGKLCKDAMEFEAVISYDFPGRIDDYKTAEGCFLVLITTDEPNPGDHTIVKDSQFVMGCRYTGEFNMSYWRIAKIDPLLDSVQYFSVVVDLPWELMSRDDSFTSVYSYFQDQVDIVQGIQGIRPQCSLRWSATDSLVFVSSSEKIHKALVHFPSLPCPGAIAASPSPERVHGVMGDAVFLWNQERSTFRTILFGITRPRNHPEILNAHAPFWLQEGPGRSTFLSAKHLPWLTDPAPYVRSSYRL